MAQADHRALEPGITGWVFGGPGKWLDTLPRWVFVVFSAALVGLIAVIDWYLPIEVHLGIYYVAPAVIVTWFVSAPAGVVLSLAAAVVWLVFDPARGAYQNPAAPVWQTILRLVFIFMAITIVSFAKRAVRGEIAASRTDPLTGVGNTRGFRDRADLAVAEMRRHGEPLTFCFIDLDHFKRVNDTLGHQAGDAVLVEFATALAGRLRETDHVARLGGDEFGVLLPETGYLEAERVLRDLRESVEESVASRWPVGYTVGAVTFLTPPESSDHMVNVADGLMYRGKHTGRDRVLHETWPLVDVIGP